MDEIKEEYPYYKMWLWTKVASIFLYSIDWFIKKE